MKLYDYVNVECLGSIVMRLALFGVHKQLLETHYTSPANNLLY